ncbi:Choline transport protein [Lachnellula arida]|uniref:Choline transport protein n=1 Tax=Lachnellula arida TaxID=1316785 RepID=A0A8T9B8J4_9HELO|nr:Choline transport protein [Lachnellula arida]
MDSIDIDNHPSVVDGKSVASSKANSNPLDQAALARLGKRQVLIRNFGLTSVTAFSCTVLVTWEGILDGGPAGLVYGYIIAWIGALATFTTIAELVSVAPIAGGQYHWVFMLAPSESKSQFSYVVAITSSGFLAGTAIQGVLVLNYPSHDFKLYQGILIGYACIGAALFVNTVLSTRLPSIESGILIVHIFKFGSFYQGMWPTQGLSVMVGLIGNVAAFTGKVLFLKVEEAYNLSTSNESGADAAVHIAEEVHDAAVTVPRAIIGSLILNGAIGFAMMLVMLFGISDIDMVLNTPTGYPYMEIFAQATNSVAGSTVLASIIIALHFAALLSFIATASRVFWSFARDRGLPFSSFLSRVNPRSSIPMNAVFVTTTIGSLLLLIAFGSALALNIILSIVLFCFYSTYFTSCAVLLWRQCQKGAIAPYVPVERSMDANTLSQVPTLT